MGGRVKESTLDRLTAEGMKPQQLKDEIFRLERAAGNTAISERMKKRFEDRLAIFRGELQSRDLVPT
jgi:hypothetical protein